MIEAPKTDKRIQILSMVVIAALACICVMLILQNKELKASSRNSILWPAKHLEPGEKVEPIMVQSLDGDTVSLQYQKLGQKYLLFVFSTTCPHCENNLPVWNHLASLAENKPGLNIVGISSERPEVLISFLHDKKPNFKIYSSAVDSSFSIKYGINGVPETMLIAGDGTVIKTWIGELQVKQSDEIQMLFWDAQEPSS